MITLANLKAFKADLEILNTDLNELIKIRSEEKLFKNYDDYNKSLTACQWYPQDYYRVRFFDIEYCLRYNNSQHFFYIKFDTQFHLDFFYKQDLKDFCKKQELKIDSELKKIYYTNEKEFEDVVKCFMYITKLFIEYYLSQDKLFYFYDF